MNGMNDHRFFQSAFKGNNKWWLYLLGFASVIFGLFLGQLPSLGYASFKARQLFPNSFLKKMEDFGESTDWSIVGANQNIGLALLLLSFGGGLLALIAVMRILHNRHVKSLITPLSDINYSKIAFGFFVWLFLSLGGEALAYFMNPQDYMLNFELRPFLILLVICLLFLPIQTSFEELFIRGYLMQTFGILFKNPLPALLLSSLFFASLHMMNPEVVKFGVGNMLFYYTIAGMLLAVVTVMDDSLELALGVHYATNISSALFVTYEGAALKTPAIFSMVNTDIDVTAVGFIIMSIIFLAICWKKYNWHSFSYLFSKIFSNDEHNYA